MPHSPPPGNIDSRRCMPAELSIDVCKRSRQSIDDHVADLDMFCCFFVVDAVVICTHAAVSGQRPAGQDVGGGVVRPTAEAGGGAEDGELQPATGAAGQLQPPHQTGDRGVQHEGACVVAGAGLL